MKAQDKADSKNKIYSPEKKPGVNLMRFGISNFYAFFISSVIGSVALDYIGLTLSLIFAGILSLVLYIVLNQVILNFSINNSSLKKIGVSKLGIPIFEIEDKLANALAVGFSKHFGYIITTTGLSNLLTEAEFSEIMEHEDNHIQQMHNLTLILPGTLTIIVLLIEIELAISHIFIFILGYILILMVGIILLFTLSRNIETLADITSDFEVFKSALRKMEEYNEQLRRTEGRPNGSKSILFRTHPPTSERPKEPSKIKHVFVAGLYISFLIVIGVVIRVIINSGFANLLWTSILFLFLIGIMVSSGIFVFDYFLITYFMKVLSKRFTMKSFNSINALNSVMIFFIISIIPIITGVSNQAVIFAFILGSLPFTILITALGTSPLKKGIIFSTLIWIINLGILTGFYVIFFPLFG